MNNKNPHRLAPFGAPGPGQQLSIRALLSLASQLCMEVMEKLIMCMNHRDPDCMFHWSILDFSMNVIAHTSFHKDEQIPILVFSS